MADEVTLAMRFATGVAVWHWVVAFYLVFVAEKLTPFRALVAFVKALFGSMVYLLIRRPQWAVEAQIYDMGIFIPLTVLLVFALSIILTILLFRSSDLKPPHERVTELVVGFKDYLFGE